MGFQYVWCIRRYYPYIRKVLLYFLFFIFKSSNSLNIWSDGAYPHTQGDPFLRQHYTECSFFSRVKTAVADVTITWPNSFSGWRVVSLQRSASQAVPHYLYLFSPFNTSWVVLGRTSPLPFTGTRRVSTHGTDQRLLTYICLNMNYD